MASEQRPSIGFIGLGIMGRPSRRNLLRSGYRVVVADVVAEPVDTLVAEGARRGTTPRDVAERTNMSSRCSRTRRRWRPSTLASTVRSKERPAGSQST